MMNFNTPSFPLNYKFETNLPSGFLGPTAKLLKNEKEPYIGKIIEVDRLGGEKVANKFIEIIKKTSTIKSHFILPYDEVFRDGNFIYLFRPYIDCPNLEEQVAGDQTPNMNAYLVLWKSVLRVCKKLHQINISPNFFKPCNIYIGPDGKPIITDIYPLVFNSANPQTGKSIIFLAPEFLNGDEPPGPSADVWSLSLLLLYMMTGQVPWDTKNLYRMMQNIMKGYKGLSVDVPDPLKQLIKDTIVADPSQRISLDKMFTTELSVSEICRTGTIVTSKVIQVQQSTFLVCDLPKLEKGLPARQSMKTISVQSSFLNQLRSQLSNPAK
ncbi:serine/threonine protein kinase [Tritrichomonas foetus]|uniref:Serine/threonine protein kinase n=1 Tax=Tritrichomonas foetus TaxID=1144522 RepID=A0A1J4K812_9EUKA|nr:serine/threonine protein kinase [Tritrichomonas foetus]|eukprot:OHT07633.1 serine/threonine protein kinase [Tritrichomonas foetus]